MGDGAGTNNPFHLVLLILVLYFVLTKIRPNVVSMCKLNAIHFSVNLFSTACKCIEVFPINDINRGGPGRPWGS